MFKKDLNNENQEESKFMKLWNNKRTHAAMVLGLWMIFLAFVMILAFVGGEAKDNINLNVPNNEEKEEIKSFRELALMQQDIVKKNFKYEYNIKIGDYQVIYKGEKIRDKETGYRETSLDTIKYYNDETGLYKILLNELDAFDKLYENLNESFIDLEYIFDLVKDKSVTTEELETTKIYTYKFLLEDVNYEIIIKTDLNNITEVTIKYDSNAYNLTFNDINQLEKLSFEPKEIEVN